MKWARWPAQSRCSRKTASKSSACGRNSRSLKSATRSSARPTWSRWPTISKPRLVKSSKPCPRHSTELEASATTLTKTAEHAQEITRVGRIGVGANCSRRGPRCSSIRSALKRSWPAGTGVWVVKTTSRGNLAGGRRRSRCLLPPCDCGWPQKPQSRCGPR